MSVILSLNSIDGTVLGCVLGSEIGVDLVLRRGVVAEVVHLALNTLDCVLHGIDGFILARVLSVVIPKANDVPTDRV